MEKEILLNLIFHLRQQARTYSGCQSHFKKGSTTHKWYGDFIHDYNRAADIVQSYMYEHQEFLKRYQPKEVIDGSTKKN